MRALLLSLLLVACKNAEPERSPQPTTASKPVAAPAATTGWIEADPATPLAATLGAQAELAIKAGKKPHAYLHASWCPPCVEIEKTRATDPKMKAAFGGTHIIAIDVDRFNSEQFDSAKLKAVVLPLFYRLDDKGAPTGATIDGGAWGDNTPDNMAPPLAAFFAK